MLKPEEQALSVCLLMAEVKIAQGKILAHRVALFLPSLLDFTYPELSKEKTEQIYSMPSLHLK